MSDTEEQLAWKPKCHTASFLQQAIEASWTHISTDPEEGNLGESCSPCRPGQRSNCPGLLPLQPRLSNHLLLASSAVIMPAIVWSVMATRHGTKEHAAPFALDSFMQSCWKEAAATISRRQKHMSVKALQETRVYGLTAFPASACC